MSLLGDMGYGACNGSGEAVVGRLRSKNGEYLQAAVELYSSHTYLSYAQA